MYISVVTIVRWASISLKISFSIAEQLYRKYWKFHSLKKICLSFNITVVYKNEPYVFIAYGVIWIAMIISNRGVEKRRKRKRITSKPFIFTDKKVHVDYQTEMLKNVTNNNNKLF